MRTLITLAILAAGMLLASCDRSPTLYEVSVTPDPPEGGTVAPAADSTLEEGRTLRLEALPAEGYRFVEWAGDLQSEENPYELEVDQDYAIMARFTLKTYNLVVNTSGEGTVSQQVVAADSSEYTHGTLVELAAAPAEGHHFVEWTGDLQSDEDTVQVLVDSPKEVTAVFEIDRHALVVHTEGEGTVSQQVIAADSTTYDWGTTVELTAEPAEGHHFVEWTGDLQSEENPEQITMEESREVTAHFDINTYELSVQAEGPGSFTISPERDLYDHGTEVEISAKPNVGYRFVEWTGDLESGENPVTVVMDSPKQIKGHFEIKTYTLDVQISGEGQVSRNPARESYEHGTEVDLTASAADHFEFVKWDGGVSGTARTVTITMDADKTAEATFLRKFVIMPLGNSLTYNPGSRERLWNLLTGDGYLVDFVGDQERPISGVSIPDTDHEGVPGITIQGIADKIEDVLSRHSPRYVNLMVGTNDIVWGYDETAGQMASRWNDLVQQILDHTPSHGYVVAATIPPATSKIVGDESLEVRDRAEQIKLFNEEIRRLVRQRQSDGGQVILADMFGQMTVAEHISDDGVHLNEAGYRLMGTIYYKALMNHLGL